MQLDQRFHHREADAQPAASLGRSCWKLFKQVKHAGQQVRSDPSAVVAHANDDLFGFGRLGSRTPAEGGQSPPPWPPRLPKRPKPPPPEPPALKPPTRSMAHLLGAVRAIETGFAMTARATTRQGGPLSRRR